MHCPRDETPLSFDGLRAHPHHRCDACSGMLLHEVHIARALGRARGASLAAAEGVRNLLALSQSAIACPRDRKPMQALIHDGIELDICATCRSVWLDHGEYEKLAASRAQESKRERDFPVDGGPGFSSDGACTSDAAADSDLDSVSSFIGEAVGALLNGL